MKFEGLGDILSQWSQRNPGLRKRFSQASVWRYWSQVVGERVSQNAWPNRVTSQGVLVVSVRDSIWMERIFLERVSILEELNKRLPDEAQLRDIRPEIGDVDAIRSIFAPTKGPHHRARHILEDIPPELMDEAEKITSNIKDKVLKERLKKAYIACKLRQKRFSV